MNTGLISVRYATALYAFTQESKKMEKVYGEAKMLTLMFEKMGELRLALENPVLPISEKRQLILTAAGEDTSKVFKQFTDLLLKNGREGQIQNIMLKFIDIYRKQKNIRNGKLTTAYEVDKITEERLVSLVTDKVGGTLELEKIVDPVILGGFLLEVEGVRWDASISGQLTRIKKEYIERNRRII
ncbi:MAG: F0F1 ATP synthase subunit delta [Paludibacteraceae bacterium]